MFAFDEVVDHPAADRARAIEGIECREVLDAGRFEFPQDIFHAGAFKLEHASREPRRKELIRLFVIQREVVHVQLESFVLFQHLQRVFDDRERREGEKIHFQQADLFDVGHRIHCRDFIFVRLV